jgi:hypothetical protein
LADEIHQVFSQARAKFDVDTNLYEKTLNFDFDNDRKLSAQEIEVASDSIKIASAALTVFLIDEIEVNMDTTSLGYTPMLGESTYCVAYPKLQNLGGNIYRVIAHEVGHSIFGLEHPWIDFEGYPNREFSPPDYTEKDKYNLMEAGDGVDWPANKLRKYQWVIVQLSIP